MNYKVTFPSSVNVASILPLIMTQTMQGGNSNYISIRIFVDSFLIFQSSELSVIPVMFSLTTLFLFEEPSLE